MTDTYEVPSDVQNKIDEEGQVKTLDNTLLKIWNVQAQQALAQLDAHTQVGFGFAIQVAQQWGLDRSQDIKEYTKAFIDASRAFWQVVADAAKEHPKALQLPEEGPDGEVNHDIYVGILNGWFKLAWTLQTEWTLAQGLPAAYGIQDAMTSFIGQQPALMSNLNSVPGFVGDTAELWQPGQEA